MKFGCITPMGENEITFMCVP